MWPFGNRVRTLGSSFKQKLKTHLKSYGPGTVVVYSTLDGCLFITSTIFIHTMQDKILDRLSEVKFIQDACPKGVHEEIHEKSEKFSTWFICRITGVEPKDMVAFVMALLILRSPIVSTPYRATVLSRIENKTIFGKFRRVYKMSKIRFFCQIF